MARLRCALGGACMLIAASSAAQSPAMLYRTPQSFRELPAPIASVLTDEGCRIPQATIDGKVVASNVVAGAFAKPGQTDWAILCAHDGRQYIRLFWGGAARCASRIEKGPATAPGGEFDRGLGTADRQFIVEHYEAYGGAKPPEIIDHLGIDYRMLEKASVVHYCHQGAWLELTGAD